MTPTSVVRAVRTSTVAAPLAVGSAALTAWAAIAALDPARVAILPCPLLALTGIACPLCGGTRAAAALAHGDIAAAVGFNALLVPGVLVGAVLWGSWVVRRARGVRAPGLALSARASAVVAGVLVLFAVLRNLPGVEWLMP
jgi:hypothetical protein